MTARIPSPRHCMVLLLRPSSLFESPALTASVLLTSTCILCLALFVPLSAPPLCSLGHPLLPLVSVFLRRRSLWIMVWFQCESCGENLKKPKLQNHFRGCAARKVLPSLRSCSSSFLVVLLRLYFCALF